MDHSLQDFDGSPAALTPIENRVSLFRHSPDTHGVSAPPILATLFSLGIIVFARLTTAVRARWVGTKPSSRPRIYFANHSSMGDFVLVWSVLPARLRRLTRPVAGSDYWLKSRLRSYIARTVFNAVLIDRDQKIIGQDPVTSMASALKGGSSLILFPEGTRNMTAQPAIPFKSGLYYLADTLPEFDLVPVWIDNVNRVLPKGEILPNPVICSVTFGKPVHLEPDEDKQQFLERARKSLVALAPTAEETP